MKNRNIAEILSAGLAAARIGRQQFKEGKNVVEVMGRPIPFILKGSLIIVKLSNDLVMGCGCGHPNCEGNKTYNLVGIGRAKLDPNDGINKIKAGVTLAAARAVREIVRQKKNIFENNIKSEISFYNQAANLVEAKIKGYKMPRLRGLKLNVVPAEPMTDAVAEAAATDEARD